MCRKVFLAVIMGLAILVGLLAVFLPPNRLDFLIAIAKFFEAMIPVLAVGALLKYLAADLCPYKHKSEVKSEE